MNPDHYAVLFGVSRYPLLGDPPPDDLKGSENDARAVRDWLIGPGGLPPGNVKLMISSDWVGGGAPQPTREDLEDAFFWLDSLADASAQAKRGRRVGSRLYLYASGHGFSPRPRQGCLLTADSAQRKSNTNVFPSGWIEWLQDADYFREHVLWMDCCMNRLVASQPQLPPLAPMGANTSTGASSIVFAATRPLKAVERPFAADNDAYHGVFTWNLLAGLKGAAVNQFGMVTGKSLADWLRQSQYAWLDPADQISPDVAKVPEVVAEDPSLILARGLAPLLFEITLRFGLGFDGCTGRIWSESPHRVVGQFSVASNTAALQLRPGLYVATLDGTDLRHGFSVTRAAALEVTERGAVPRAETGIFEVRIEPEPADATADITIIGAGFQTADHASGTLHSRLPAGVYQTRLRIGRQLVEKVMLLDADWPGGTTESAPAHMPAMPEITSAAPILGSRTCRDYHRDALVYQRRPEAKAVITIMARRFTLSGDDPGPLPTVMPWEGVALFNDRNKVVMSLGVEHRIALEAGQDPAALIHFEVSPGAYQVRYPCAGIGTVAQSLVVPVGWRVEVYLLQLVGEAALSQRPRISVLMSKLEPWIASNEDDQLRLAFEKARVTLTDERVINNDFVRDMIGSEDLLMQKFVNPLAGIVGAHLMLMAQDQTGEFDAALFDTVIRNLRGLLGTEHPDVEALSLAGGTERSDAKAIRSAPMFERSWPLLIKESQVKRSFVPVITVEDRARCCAGSSILCLERRGRCTERISLGRGRQRAWCAPRRRRRGFGSIGKRRSTLECAHRHAIRTRGARQSSCVGLGRRS